MEIKVYLHRTKKKDFAVADCFSVFVDLDKLPEDKRNDVDFINEGFKNDCQKHAKTMECVQRYGTAYISFMRPQYEGPEEENNGEIYFDNEQMLFMKRKVKKTRKKKETIENEEKKK